jgi:hypothetical protein
MNVELSYLLASEGKRVMNRGSTGVIFSPSIEFRGTGLIIQQGAIAVEAKSWLVYCKIVDLPHFDTASVTCQ